MRILLDVYFNRGTKVTDQTFSVLGSGIRNMKHLTVLSLDFEYFLLVFGFRDMALFFTSLKNKKCKYDINLKVKPKSPGRA